MTKCVTTMECRACGASLLGVDDYTDENLDLIFPCPSCGYLNNEYDGLWGEEYHRLACCCGSCKLWLEDKKFYRKILAATPH